MVVDDAVDQIRATGVGPALIVVERRDGNDPPVQAVAAINPLHAASIVASDATARTDQASPEAQLEPDVYPGTLTLVPGSTRQLRVHLVDPASGERIDIHGASQIAFAGLPEEVETYLDPLTQQALIDPETGDFVIDPDTGEIVLDPQSGETLTFVFPAVPEVRNGTRYLVSDERIASVSDDGLITAHGSGRVTLSVVHLTHVVDDWGNVSAAAIGQTDVALLVEAPQPIDDDPATAAPAGRIVAAEHGGVVQAATGETVMIGAGALKSDARVSIRRLELAQLEAETGLRAPEPGPAAALAAFHLELGDAADAGPGSTRRSRCRTRAACRKGDEVLFLRRGWHRQRLPHSLQDAVVGTRQRLRRHRRQRPSAGPDSQPTVQRNHRIGRPGLRQDHPRSANRSGQGQGMRGSTSSPCA